MRNLNTLSLSIFALLMSMLIISPVTGLNGVKSVDYMIIETDKIVIEVKGGAYNPFFFLYEKGQDTNESAHYKFQLDQIFESEDLNNNTSYEFENDTIVPQSQLSLASLMWEFSEFDVVTDENGVTTALNFNLTSTEDKSEFEPTNGTLEKDPFYIQFRMHVDTVNTAQIKFDVIIDGYEFNSASAMLVIAFKLITVQNRNAIYADNSFSFGETYFTSEPKAKSTFANDTFGETKVGLSTAFSDGNNRVYVAYENFNGTTLVHDPIIGLSGISNDPLGNEITDPTDAIDDADASSDQSSGDALIIIPDLSKADVFVINLIAVFAFLLIPVIVYKVKK